MIKFISVFNYADLWSIEVYQNEEPTHKFVQWMETETGKTPFRCVTVNRLDMAETWSQMQTEANATECQRLFDSGRLK